VTASRARGIHSATLEVDDPVLETDRGLLDAH